MIGGSGTTANDWLFALSLGLLAPECGVLKQGDPIPAASLNASNSRLKFDLLLTQKVI